MSSINRITLISPSLCHKKIEDTSHLVARNDNQRTALTIVRNGVIIGPPVLNGLINKWGFTGVSLGLFI